MMAMMEIDDVYAEDRHRTWLEMEDEPRPRWIQQSISLSYHTVMVNWIVNMCSRHNQCQETMFMAVSILDRFLTRQKLVRNQATLACGAALWIASKFEEVYEVLDVHEILAKVSGGFFLKHILVMERRILHTLEFNLCVPTVFTFLRDKSEVTHDLARRCLTLWSLRKYKPSVIAEAIQHVEATGGIGIGDRGDHPCVREIVAFLSSS